MSHTFNTMLQNINEASSRVPCHCSEDFEQRKNIIYEKKKFIRLITFNMNLKAQIQVLKYTET